MKKLLLGMTGLILSFTLVLVGCSDNTTDLNLGSIGGPRNLTVVTDVPGAVILTWERAKDAYGYRVVREDRETRETVDFGDIGDTTYFADVVDPNNMLTHGRRYLYTVYSIPSQSKDVLEGSDAREAVANVPDRDAAVTTWPADVMVFRNFAAERRTIGNAEVLVVRFDEVPGVFNYNIRYNYGTNNALIVQLPQTGEIPANNGQPVVAGRRHRVVYFPLVAGENTLNVEATLAESRLSATQQTLRNNTHFNQVIARTPEVISTPGARLTQPSQQEVNGLQFQRRWNEAGTAQIASVYINNVPAIRGATGYQVWIQEVRANGTYGAWDNRTVAEYDADLNRLTVSVPVIDFASTAADRVTSYRAVLIATGAGGVTSIPSPIFNITQ